MGTWLRLTHFVAPQLLQSQFSPGCGSSSPPHLLKVKESERCSHLLWPFGQTTMTTLPLASQCVRVSSQISWVVTSWTVAVKVPPCYIFNLDRWYYFKFGQILLSIWTNSRCHILDSCIQILELTFHNFFSKWFKFWLLSFFMLKPLLRADCRSSRPWKKSWTWIIENGQRNG